MRNQVQSGVRASAAAAAREECETVSLIEAQANAGVLGRTPSYYLSLLALVVSLFGLVMLTGPADAGSVFITAGAILALLSAVLMQRAQQSREAGESSSLPLLAQRIEELKDAQWELNETAVRYRDLLDQQEDMISRRDSEGRHIFANRAFCRMFGLEPEKVPGMVFVPDVLDGSPPPELAVGILLNRQFEELVRTEKGPRWIAWEERLVRAANDSGFEVQCIGRDVTAAREAEADLLEARDQAEAANRAKSRFLASMSHEIRTPMNGILGMAGLLAGTGLDAEQVSYLGAIDTSARALLALIDEILDFSKIEAGRLELIRAPFALTAPVISAVELFSPKALEKGLNLGWSAAPDLPEFVDGDEARVRQIVLNLVSNAIKFTDAGSVHVRLSRADIADGKSAHLMAISVTDTGIGLSEDEIKRLFREFEQTETAIARRNGGTGLGLAISRRLARVMGGDITVKGVEGCGATFSALLLLPPVTAEQASQTNHDWSGPIQPDLFAPDAQPKLETSFRPRILIAEDNEINALLARRVVEKAACEAEVVATGIEAVAAVERSFKAGGRPFDLVLMDVFMPGLDGIGATRAIRDICGAKERAGLGWLPIVALTANAFAEDRQHCLDAGMDDYLAKPFDVQGLHRVLGRWVA